MHEYLKTGVGDHVNNDRDWGIPLGRRFRALKLWFVIQSYGVEGLKNKVRHHLELTNYFVSLLDKRNDIELLVPVNLNVVCFRFNPGKLDEEKLNIINEQLLKNLNKSGKLFMTHTKLKGKYTLRFVIAQNLVEKRHIDSAWEEITKTMMKQ